MIQDEENQIDTIQVVGLQRSGTNYLERLLRKNFLENIVHSDDTSYFFKHSFPQQGGFIQNKTGIKIKQRQPIEVIKELDTFATIRIQKTFSVWFASIKRYKADLHVKNPELFENNFISYQAAYNLYKKYDQKWREVEKEFPEKCKLVHYTDLLQKPDKIIHEIKDTFSLVQKNNYIKLIEKVPQSDNANFSIRMDRVKQAEVQINNEKKMKILIANHHLEQPGGTECWCADMADTLRRHNYSVDMWALSRGSFAQQVDAISTPETDYDLILANHFTTLAYLQKVRGVKIFTCHGTVPILETPATGADEYVAVSDEIANFYHWLPTTTIYNAVCSEKYNAPKINDKPKTVLSLCQGEKADELVKKACERENLHFISTQKNKIYDVEQLIATSDIVVSLGRGAIQAMMMGREVIVLDSREYMGEDNLGDGLLNEGNLDHSRYSNYSGRAKKISYNIDLLQQDFRNYDQNRGAANRRYAIKYHSLNVAVDTYLKLYEIIINNKKQNTLDRYVEQKLSENFLTKISPEIVNYHKLLKKVTTINKNFANLENDNKNLSQINDQLSETNDQLFRDSSNAHKKLEETIKDYNSKKENLQKKITDLKNENSMLKLQSRNQTKILQKLKNNRIFGFYVQKIIAKNSK